MRQADRWVAVSLLDPDSKRTLESHLGWKRKQNSHFALHSARNLPESHQPDQQYGQRRYLDTVPGQSKNLVLQPGLACRRKCVFSRITLISCSFSDGHESNPGYRCSAYSHEQSKRA